MSGAGEPAPAAAAPAAAAPAAAAPAAAAAPPVAAAQPADNRGGAPTVAELRAEAAAERIAKREAIRERDEAREQLAAEKKRVETEVEAKVKPVNEKLTKFQTRLIDAELKVAAQAAGMTDLDLLPLIDRTGIKIDDEGKIEGIEAAITAKKTAKPDWFKVTKQETSAEKAAREAAEAAAARAKGPTGSAATPPAGGAATPPTDVKGLDKAAYDKWKKDNVRQLRGH